ncbi:rod-binding protein [Trichlorobacter lovleyi]|uniref:Flagellar protein FlgJ-like protein n=2 Tax=Trichlorobacter lovleyi TaxID=313985 RepID=B3EAV0_TRIL1|nr:rod-binding protein [Trichlorobacter lovleyi]ACD96983.1 flagellar protein FlgJ-like protein [Trichlorobacter lovleyi SZ]
MMDSTLTIAPDLLVQDKQAEQLGSRAKLSAHQLTDAERKKLKKISQDFEALFTGMMLKSMRATVPEDKLTGGGKAEETYRYMLDQEYAAAAAKRGGTNSIASMVEKELLKRYAVPAQKKGGGTAGEEQ